MFQSMRILKIHDFLDNKFNSVINEKYKQNQLSYRIFCAKRDVSVMAIIGEDVEQLVLPTSLTDTIFKAYHDD